LNDSGWQTDNQVVEYEQTIGPEIDDAVEWDIASGLKVPEWHFHKTRKIVRFCRSQEYKRKKREQKNLIIQNTVHKNFPSPLCHSSNKIARILRVGLVEP